MGNGISRAGYIPKMTQWEALEKMSVKLRQVINGSVTTWDCVAAYKYEKKNGTRAAIEWIHNGNLNESKRPLIKGGLRGRGNYVTGQPSSYVECEVKPLLGYTI